MPDTETAHFTMPAEGSPHITMDLCEKVLARKWRGRTLTNRREVQDAPGLPKGLSVIYDVEPAV